MDEDDFSDESVADSDAELQEAFARGDLKPGLVILEKNAESKPEKPVAINNVPRLEAMLKQIKLPSSFSWAERLDVISGLAPLAPEIAVQLDEHKEKREKEINIANSRKKKKKGPATPTLKSIEEDPIHNDFQRELNFHRQAQSAIMNCLPRLQALGIPTRRPKDYFAEMAKTDTHMQKVASVLLKKQTAAEKAEKVRKVRDQKKIAKQTQVQVMQDRHKAKRELIDNVKKYRKGQKNSLDFLEEKRSGGGSRGGRGGGGGNKKREMKNERYGYGGKKAGSKRNTKDSLDNVASRGFGRGRGGGNTGRGGGRLGNMNRGGPPSGGRGMNAGRGGRGGGGQRGMRRDAGRGSTRGAAKRPGKINRIKARANGSHKS